MKSLTYSTTRRMPELNVVCTAIKQREYSVEFWKAMYADAGSQSVIAWRMYQDAIDNEDPRGVINSLFETAQLYDDICRDAWGELENAKRNLLALYN